MGDDFQSPQPHLASAVSDVNAVLSHVVTAGNSLLSLLSGLLAAALILYSSVVLYDTFYTENSAANTPYALLKYKPSVLIDNGVSPSAGGEVLSAINPDYRAWLTMFDTNIDYPIMQGIDDVYYASHDVYGQVSLTGSIYLAAGNTGDCSDSYNLIYGHHMDNKAMFGGLDDFREESYFNSHREGTLVTQSGVYDLYTFAVIDTDAYVDEVYEVGDRMDEVLAFLRARAESPDDKTHVRILDESVLEGAERIVALSTCADAETYGRLVVFATMTRRNLLTLDAEGYEGVFDNESHGPDRVEVNYTEGTSFSYSTDNGATWTEGLPSVKDVGEVQVLLRAENPIYGTATAAVTLKVTPKPLTIKVRDEFKVWGTPDPEWSIEPIEGILDGFVPSYTIHRTNSDVEDAGTYPGVLVAEGETLQGNYSISFVPGDFTITAADKLVLIAEGYSDVYDGQAHAPKRVEVNIPEGTTIEYSLDDGATWSLTAPTITNVGVTNVRVRATNPNFVPVETSITLQVTPATLIVTAQDASKQVGSNDPPFSATVSGSVDSFQPVYTISRPRAGIDESIGVYVGAIIPMGEASQGNYYVIYVPGTFTIHNLSPRTGDDSEPPIGNLMDVFTPKPGRNTPAWALVNLICLLVTAFLFVPLLHLKAKYGRLRNMKKLNEEKCELHRAIELDENQRTERDRILNDAVWEKRRKGESVGWDDITKNDFAAAVERLYYHVEAFARQFRCGFVLELVDVIAAVIAFILTEDMRLPMILIDKWTPLMVLLLLICWIVDVRLMRYRDKPKAYEEEKEAQPA